MDKESKHRCFCIGRPVLNTQVLVDIGIWCLICVPVLVFFLWVTPFTQGFFCDDRSLQYPYRPDTISTPILMIAGLGIPISMILLTEVVRRIDQNRGDKRYRMDWTMALKGVGFFLFGVMINKVFTEVTKHSLGRLRPNFFALCKPDFNSINCSKGYITEYTCTNTEFSEREIRDSRLSFPSGHASFGMFCAVYSALYLQARFLFKSSVLVKPTMQACLVLIAVWCGITRITDHKHFWSDVIAGFTSGTIMAWLVFYKVAWVSLRTVKFAQFPRSFSVSCSSEPQTPDPLLKESKNQFSVYLDDAIKTDRSKSLV